MKAKYSFNRCIFNDKIESYFNIIALKTDLEVECPFGNWMSPASMELIDFSQWVAMSQVKNHVELQYLSSAESIPLISVNCLRSSAP